MTQAGPVPHLPENGKVVAFGPWGNVVWEVASGAPLLVDLEVGRHFDLFVFALAQGTWNGPREGTPALPFTGSLVEARLDGTFRVIAGGGGAQHTDVDGDHRRHGLRRELRRPDLESRAHLGVRQARQATLGAR